MARTNDGSTLHRPPFPGRTFASGTVAQEQEQESALLRSAQARITTQPEYCAAHVRLPSGGILRKPRLYDDSKKHVCRFSNLLRRLCSPTKADTLRSI